MQYVLFLLLNLQMLKSINTVHMAWISGNLNELEDPIAKLISLYVCGCPIKQLARIC